MSVQLCTQKGCNGDLFVLRVNTDVDNPTPQVDVVSTLTNPALHFEFRDNIFGRIINIKGVSDVFFVDNTLNVQVVSRLGWETVKPVLMEILEESSQPGKGVFWNTGTGQEYFTSWKPAASWYVGLRLNQSRILAA